MPFLDFLREKLPHVVVCCGPTVSTTPPDIETAQAQVKLPEASINKSFPHF